MVSSRRRDFPPRYVERESDPVISDERAPAAAPSGQTPLNARARKRVARHATYTVTYIPQKLSLTMITHNLETGVETGHRLFTLSKFEVFLLR